MELLCVVLKLSKSGSKTTSVRRPLRHRLAEDVSSDTAALFNSEPLSDLMFSRMFLAKLSFFEGTSPGTFAPATARMAIPARSTHPGAFSSAIARMANTGMIALLPAGRQSVRFLWHGAPGLESNAKVDFTHHAVEHSSTQHDAFQVSAAPRSTDPGTVHRHRYLQHCKCTSPR